MSLKKKFAVVLSGCGKIDGSEIHEATTALLAISSAGAIYECFAPNIEQARTINHINGNIQSIYGDKHNRNVMEEAARIARGDIKDVHLLDVENYDAIVFPGGMGAVSNLCDYAIKGVNCHVNVSIEKIIKEANKKGIAIGAMCIAPVLIAKVLGSKGVEVTIGDDAKVSFDIKSMGAKHKNIAANDVLVDYNNKVVTTPAYMLASSIKEVYEGAEKMVRELISLM